MGDAEDETDKQNPFRMPSDEEIFSLRDEERARKEEVGQSFLQQESMRGGLNSVVWDVAGASAVPDPTGS